MLKTLYHDELHGRPAPFLVLHVPQALPAAGEVKVEGGGAHA